MRKAQKKEILDMIQTLHEAHEQIKEHIDRNNSVAAQDMLAQCQECAVSIGNAIETLEKEDCVTISHIQDYCDLVYQIYEALQNNTDSNANKIYKNLKKQLLRIENSVKNDISVRKEVVFFPYKASMWDSLESVYLAAKEDPESDAYCVPIPYYDRNPNHSLGQMHYEGNEYPKNIEVIDWQSYNFEERKPDVIYIHNPYDDWNLVTCVHPRYFSSNLKKYTEKLVYIPYFVLQEIEPDDQRAIDTIKHFVWTPGVINADKVIVQSEKMKQIYVNEYLKAAQENGLQGNHLDRKYLEDKFQGLGSPKIDKVLNTKKEDLEIPEEWLKIIQKPDGGWKKIILYNTSIAALLENNEKMLEKMKDVFRIFYENRNEVALLWRPHPLIKSTVSSMRPQLWVEYEKLVKWYKEEGWGIYDDTADMERAVVISDAYYGDGSSVVQVYQKTGKPIMLENVDVNSFSQALSVSVRGALIDEDECWFPSTEMNGLFYGKLGKNKDLYCNKVFEFTDIEEDNQYIIRSVINTEDAIYFFPLFNQNCWKWSKKERKITKEVCAETNHKRIANVEMIENNIWIIPCEFKDTIICYDYTDGTNDEINWANNIYENADENSITRTVVYENNIYFCTRVPDKILLYKIDCTSKKVFCNPIKNIHYVNCIGICEGNLWILGKNRENQTFLAKVDINNLDKTKEVIIPLKIIDIEKSRKLTYFKMVTYEKKLFLIPAYGENIFVFNTETFEEKIIEYPEEIKNKSGLFFETQQKENLLYLFPYKSNLLLLLDMNKCTISKVQVIAKYEDYIGLQKEKEIKTEGENLKLDLLIHSNLNRTYDPYVNTYSGSNIYDKMSRCV